MTRMRKVHSLVHVAHPITPFDPGQRIFNILLELFITTLILIVTLSSKTKCENDLSILDHLLKGYDRRALPESLKGKPTPVACEIYIRSFGSINPATMDYEVDLYLRQTWLDERLKTPKLSKPLDLNDAKLVQMIWKPEVFFANAKHAEFQYVTVPNVLVRINPNGTILYMLRLKLRFSCMMDLYRFPMDSQVCAIELASFSKTTDELQLKWKETNPIVLYENLKLPQFQIEHWNTSLCKEKFQFGEYSCLKAEFYLQRSLGYHLVQSYLPTSLIVFISWVSFWLDIDAIPARVTLGVTTLLTISSKDSFFTWPRPVSVNLPWLSHQLILSSSGIQTNLPPVSYVKAIDVWMGACTTFVFAALLEFTCVNYLWRKRCKRRATQFRQTIANLKANHNSNANPSANSDQSKRDDVSRAKLQAFTGPTDESIGIALARFQSAPMGGNGNNDNHPHTRYQLGEVPVASGIDRICRFLFPMLFLLFNTVYWPYYIY